MLQIYILNLINKQRIIISYHNFKPINIKIKHLFVKVINIQNIHKNLKRTSHNS